MKQKYIHSSDDDDHLLVTGTTRIASIGLSRKNCNDGSSSLINDTLGHC
jgi:hypothetical protein